MRAETGHVKGHEDGTAQGAVVADWLAVLTAGAPTFELRALKVRANYGRPYTESGYFDRDHLTQAAEAALRLSDRAKGVYLTLNPLKPDLLARRCNRTDRAEEDELTKDGDVSRRQWLYLDVDPVRPANISATDAEKELARGKAEEIRAALRARGWPDPVFGDSGNGYLLLYAIDLQADDGGLVERCLKTLAQQHDSEHAKVDVSVHNRSRIIKVPGTAARKGDDARDQGRPHRRSRLLEVPGCPDPHDVTSANVEVVPQGLLEALAAELKAAQPAPPATPPPGPGSSANGSSAFTARAGGTNGKLKMEVFLAARGVVFRRKAEPTDEGATVWQVTCPFDSTHAIPDACVFQWPSGKLGFKCSHNSCSGFRWQEFKAKVGAPDPDHYDRPLSGQARPAGGDGPGPEGRASPVVYRVQDVTRKRMEWLWPGWFPRGAISILDGDPGMGKTTIILDIIARLTRGWPMPTGGPALLAPANALILTAEDDYACTIRPRLEEAGADLARVFIVDCLKSGDLEVPLSLPTHVSVLEKLVRRYEAALVAIDPLVAYLDRNLDAHKDQDVRFALAPCRKLCERTGCTMTALRHLNKVNGAPALYRGGGSIGMTGAARAALVVGLDPDDANRRVLAMAKVNGAPRPRSLTYDLAPTADPTIAKILWGPPCDLTADDIVTRPQTRSSPARNAAKAFLLDLLKSGPVAADEVTRQATAAGLTEKSLRRAKKDLGVATYREGYGKEGRWLWHIPKDGHQSPRTQDVATFGDWCQEETPRDELEVPIGGQQEVAAYGEPTIVGQQEVANNGEAGFVETPVKLTPVSKDGHEACPGGFVAIFEGPEEEFGDAWEPEKEV